MLITDQDGQALCEVRTRECSHLVLYGNIQVSTPVIQDLCRRGIPISYLSSNGWLLGTTQGMGQKNIELRLRQFAAAMSPAHSLALSRRFISAKIANCRTILRRNHMDDVETTLTALRQHHQHALQAKAAEALLGIEGLAARAYFSAFAGMLRPRGHSASFTFGGRNRRPPRDPVNALLSFTYSLLMREWLMILTAVGFDPFLGFFHRPRYGRPSLALDMMEEFRPIVADSVVVTLINNGEIASSDFVTHDGATFLAPSGRSKVIAAFERRLGQEIAHPVFGYQVSYRRTFEVQARLLGRFLSGEIQEFPPFLTR